MVAQARTLSLIDVVIPVDRFGARDVALIVLFSLITAGCARSSTRLPFTPVPITRQTPAVTNDKVMEYGLYPFIAVDLIKLYIAAITVPAAWSILNLKQHREGPWT